MIHEIEPHKYDPEYRNIDASDEDISVMIGREPRK